MRIIKNYTFSTNPFNSINCKKRITNNKEGLSTKKNAAPPTPNSKPQTINKKEQGFATLSHRPGVLRDIKFLKCENKNKFSEKTIENPSGPKIFLQARFHTPSAEISLLSM